MSNLPKFCAKTVLPEVVPVLLRLLNRQEEDADEDGWNIHIHSYLLSKPTSSFPVGISGL
ncbi:hypothetical protein BKA83DRAFT_3005016 [Pisolithus microcarpus]|nr:hypothetical protein BKA83DRAFT_3005016 [Pisolithus microcarpus]